MDPRIWHKVAAISGVAALGLGTYGAHMFKPKNPAYKDVWHTASLYHLVHTAALVSAPLARNPNIFGGLLTTGIIAFSGTCYTVALLEDKNTLPWLRLVALHSSLLGQVCSFRGFGFSKLHPLPYAVHVSSRSLVFGIWIFVISRTQSSNA